MSVKTYGYQIRYPEDSETTAFRIDSPNPPLSEEPLEILISRRLSCMHTTMQQSQFLDRHRFCKQNTLGKKARSTAENIELLKLGVNELLLGELMAFDGRHSLFDNKELWKKKIWDASQDRGLLSLNAPSITDVSFAYLLQALGETPQVRYLCIDTELTDGQIIMLAEAIAPVGRAPLNLEGLYFNMDNHPHAQAMERLFAAIGKNPHLHSLSFRYMAFDESDAEEMNNHLGKTNIHSISIKSSAFYENGIHSVIGLFKKNHHLTSLRLSYCSETELLALFSALNETGLTDLDLSQCEITIRAIDLLTSVVSTNQKLECLYLRSITCFNYETLLALSRLQDAIDKNTHLKQVSLPDPSMRRWGSLLKANPNAFSL